MTGKFFGIGLGPGDPELLTLKAVRVLREAEVVVAPFSKKKGTGCAVLPLVQEFLKPGVEIAELPIPRVYDPQRLMEACRSIIHWLQAGKRVAFISRGNPMLYSKYVYIHEMLVRENIEVETIPGISSHEAASCRAGFPLAEEEEAITIYPVKEDDDQLEQVIASAESLVLLKVHKNLDNIIDLLEKHGFHSKAVLISRLGHEDEFIQRDLNQLREKQLTYLSTILARK